MAIGFYYRTRGLGDYPQRTVVGAAGVDCPPLITFTRALFTRCITPRVVTDVNTPGPRIDFA